MPVIVVAISTYGRISRLNHESGYAGIGNRRPYHHADPAQAICQQRRQTVNLESKRYAVRRGERDSVV